MLRTELEFRPEPIERGVGEYLGHEMAQMQITVSGARQKLITNADGTKRFAHNLHEESIAGNLADAVANKKGFDKVLNKLYRGDAKLYFKIGAVGVVSIIVMNTAVKTAVGRDMFNTHDFVRGLEIGKSLVASAHKGIKNLHDHSKDEVYQNRKPSISPGLPSSH